jgi:RNA polymerase sigma factor (TIGR02999 family)
MPESENITKLLISWENGDETALEKLMPVVYAELRRIAANYLRRERSDHTLQPTALVHEAFLRLIDQKSPRWQARAQFYGLAAQLMRRILVDHARKNQAAKRGGGYQERVSISGMESLDEPQTVGKSQIDLVALNDAMTELTEIDPQLSRIVELRFFGGLSIEETAQVLHLGHASVERDWKVARAWLRGKLEEPSAG